MEFRLGQSRLDHSGLPDYPSRDLVRLNMSLAMNDASVDAVHHVDPGRTFSSVPS